MGLALGMALAVGAIVDVGLGVLVSVMVALAAGVALTAEVGVFCGSGVAVKVAVGARLAGAVIAVGPHALKIKPNKHNQRNKIFIFIKNLKFTANKKMAWSAREIRHFFRYFLCTMLHHDPAQEKTPAIRGFGREQPFIPHPG